VLLAWPEVAIGWTECGRRLLVTFPDGCTCSLWEPNFYFSFPSFSVAWIHNRAIEAIDGQHQMLLSKAI
jgi:hypothetical protein